MTTNAKPKQDPAQRGFELEQWHEVVSGDTLSKIARNYYGDPALYRIVTIATLALSLGLSACGSGDKGPAEAAMAAAGKAVDAVREDGMKYAGEQFTQLEGALSSAKDQLAKGEFKAAIEGAGGLAAKAQEVAKAAADKKAQLGTAWSEFEGGIPKMMEGLKSRLDILSQAKKLPAGIDKAKLDGLRATYDEAAATFAKAKESAASGDFLQATQTGAAIKSKLMEIATALGLKQAS